MMQKTDMQDVLAPRDEQDVADIVAGASGPLTIMGGNTRPVGADVTGQALTTSALTGITLYEPGALTLVAQPGTSVGEIETVLAAENQRLAFEPMDHRALLGTIGTPTIGGVLAGNISGPRRVQVGAARDHALGVRFVDGAGTILKNGGRVMKNVTGYDLVKLMAGSWGTLGVLTEVAFKVLPNVEGAATISVTTPDAVQAVAAMSTALGAPYDVNGAAYVNGVVSIRVEGFEKSVIYRAQMLRGILAGFGDVAVNDDLDQVRKDWAYIRDAGPLHGVGGDIWRICVKPTDGPAVFAALNSTAFMDWGGGLVWAAVTPGTDVRAKLADIAGHATLYRADAETRTILGTFQPEGAALAAITAGIRAKFDPRGILNPGRMT